MGTESPTNWTRPVLILNSYLIRLPPCYPTKVLLSRISSCCIHRVLHLVTPQCVSDTHTHLQRKFRAGEVPGVLSHGARRQPASLSREGSPERPCPLELDGEVLSQLQRKFRAEFDDFSLSYPCEPSYLPTDLPTTGAMD